ncbi:hypothetical protein SFRURICE_005183 [Spodoptera frugiperda]|nr:hypothetical protein SFRURICE_005183 [Spodoptera frugiperda]
MPRARKAWGHVEGSRGVLGGAMQLHQGSAAAASRGARVITTLFELAGVGLMCASERCDMESPGEETGRVVPPAPHTPAAPQPNNGSNKIIGRNVNGTSIK